MSKISVDEQCLMSIRPTPITTSWYDASIDVVGKHLSGLLLFKEMPDASRRVVFTNESGVKFFDFEFAGKAFKVHHIIPQLDRHAVVNLLRRDFWLILDSNADTSEVASWKRGQEIYLGVKDDGKLTYYVTDAECGKLQRMESGSKRKKVTSVFRYGDSNSVSPDSLILVHHTFDMKLTLRKLDKDNAP